MRRFVAGLLDSFIAVITLVVVFVLMTGGGVYRISDGFRVSVRSIENPLGILALLLVARYLVRLWSPWFGVRRWHAATVLGSATHVVRSAGEWARRLSTTRGRRFVTAAVGITLVLKAWFAYADPGFFSGDDVEIHEMALGVLLNRQWPIWDLRSAVFPMGFIYPAQWAALQTGFHDVGELVVAGRLVVATLSCLTVWLTWHIARLWWPGERGYAVLAACFVATTKLQVAFGASELPRPVATVLVLLAFLLLQQHGTMRTATAGFALGCAACLRFSEAVFLIPALLQLASERRPRDALLLTAVTGGVAVGLIGLSDRWYWGEAFHSLRAIIDFTLVQRLSSRGYEPWWWYLASLTQWINPSVFVLAVLGWRSAPYASWWAAIPLVILSALPHKEARYLIPLTPFVCLLAAGALRSVVAQVQRHAAPPWVSAALIAALVFGLAQDVSHYRLRRSNHDVKFARQVFSDTPKPRSIIAEQAWRIGGRLYADGISLTDLDPGLLQQPEYLQARLTPDAWLLIDRNTAERASIRHLLVSSGFRQVRSSMQSLYTLWCSTRCP